ncbi:TRAP transporter substrate-binding protein [Acuticoccus kandeliae]|uniref:TRAP transporter substrate-binding protein n=1 Tax=Acuticoccus kandeliae TaxID=2073160 RepID=UPI000D3E707C|nr:TRAP transporter substrate-binding protein [Acuticoccus kandeliae]
MKLKALALSTVLLGSVFAATSASAIDIGFALHTSPPGPEFEAVDKFKELVEERSNGEIRVRTYPSAVLGGERDNVEQLTVNEVQMTLNGDLLVSVIAPEYAAVVTPFVFPGPEEVYAFWDSEIGAKAKAAIKEKAGIDVVAFHRRGDRHLTANKAIPTPADIKGLKLRVPEIPSWVQAWTAVGASPTPVAYPELFSALQMGVVEGQENPCFNINQAKMYEVQSHIMLTAHVPAVFHWSISSKFLDSLSPELRDIVVNSAVEAAAYGDKVAQEQIEATCEGLSKEHGMEVVEVDRAAYVAAARPAIEKLAEGWAPGVMEAVSQYLD